MRISDWISDVCSSDLKSSRTGAVSVSSFTPPNSIDFPRRLANAQKKYHSSVRSEPSGGSSNCGEYCTQGAGKNAKPYALTGKSALSYIARGGITRSEEHTSELQSLMRISSAVFCLKKKQKTHISHTNNTQTTTHTSHAEI